MYGPVSFGKKTDKNGDYIRKYLPVLKKCRKVYIRALDSTFTCQKAAGCIVGKDYPEPIVDHKIVSRETSDGWLRRTGKSHETG